MGSARPKPTLMMQRMCSFIIDGLNTLILLVGLRLDVLDQGLVGEFAGPGFRRGRAGHAQLQPDPVLDGGLGFVAERPQVMQEVIWEARLNAFRIDLFVLVSV